MSELMVIITALLTVVLVMLFASIRTAITIRRDFNQRFDRLRSGMEEDATHILQTLLRRSPTRSSARTPRPSHLRRIK